MVGQSRKEGIFHRKLSDSHSEGNTETDRIGFEYALEPKVFNANFHLIVC